MWSDGEEQARSEAQREEGEQAGQAGEVHPVAGATRHGGTLGHAAAVVAAGRRQLRGW
jgi:hypothetical protein